MKVTEYYKLLGISPDAGPEEIKRAHRRLVKQWHPDLYTDPAKQKEAQQKLIQINKAYQYAKTFSQIRHAARQATYTTRKANNRASGKRRSSYARSHSTRNKQQTGNQKSYGTSRTSSSGSASNYTHNGARQSGVRRNWLDEKIHRLSRYLQFRNLSRRRQRNEKNINDELRKAERINQRKRMNMHARTRVGMYRSRFNQLVFRIISFFSGGDTLKTDLAGYNASRKYEVEIRHRLIEDRIFYSVNNSFNFTLKYIFGVFLGMQFIYNIYISFFMGRMIADPVTFFSAQLIVTGIAVLLFIPDSLFQRLVLWQYRKIPLNQISEYFSGRKLPSPWNFWKHVVIGAKYTLVTMSIWFGYY